MQLWTGSVSTDHLVPSRASDGVTAPHIEAITAIFMRKASCGGQPAPGVAQWKINAAAQRGASVNRRIAAVLLEIPLEAFIPACTGVDSSSNSPPQS